MQGVLTEANRRRLRLRRCRTFQWSKNIIFLLMLIACPFLFAQGARAHSEEGTGSPSPIIGIDLGTTYSCVSVMVDGKVEIIPNDLGNRITPSYVSFEKGNRRVGEAAKLGLSSNPSKTVFDAKRLIGRSYSDKSVQDDIKNFPFNVVNKGGIPAIKIDGRSYAPEEISAMILRKLKDSAEIYLGQSVEEAVITVPAFFTDAQRAATKDAARIAGLNAVRIINEPTAAAMAYGLDRETGSERNIVVYDLGGGTFDVSILVLDDGAFEVSSTAGDTHLGGEDFDQRVIDYFVSKYERDTGINVSKNSKSMTTLKGEVERAKRILSAEPSTIIDIENFSNGQKFYETLTRAKFEELNADLFRKTLGPVKQALRDAKLDPKSVGDIILVGGSTRIPRVRSMLEEFFGKAPLTNVNPDEAVAEGAAIQGCVLNGSKGCERVVMMDVNPLTLGIETAGGEMTEIIKRGTMIPTRKSQVFSTTADNQAVVSIRVYEGERPRTRQNNLLGEFELGGIPPAPRGVPKIEVVFEIDSNGILKVSAEDKGTNQMRSLTITGNGRLSQGEVERMIAEAAEHEAEDRDTREKVEAKRGLETLLMSVKKELKDGWGAGSKISEEEKHEMEEAIFDTFRWVDSDDGSATASEYEQRQGEVSSMVHAITENLYRGEDGPDDGWGWDHGEL